MAPLPSATAAVIVAYRHPPPDPSVLQRLVQLVHTLIVVDNHPGQRDTLARQCEGVGAAYLHRGNQGKLAGAYNAALQWLACHGPPATAQVLFLDEDSDLQRLEAFLRDPQTQASLADRSVAAISAAYRDRATGLRGAYLELGRWRPNYLPREFHGLRDVAFVINSMSLWSFEALQQLGPFDEQLGLDGIDTEMCLRARQRGLRLLVHGDHEFQHSIGQRQRFMLWGRQMQSSGHSPARRWMIARNNVWLARREWRREPAFALLCLQRLAYEAVGIALAERDRGHKLLALCRGTLAGLRSEPMP